MSDLASHNHNREHICMTFSVVTVRVKVRLLIYFLKDPLYDYAVSHCKAYTRVGPWKMVATELEQDSV